VSFRVIDLAGSAWSLREALGETWRWYVDAALPAAGNNVAEASAGAAAAPGWWPARVPGSVVTDLAGAGELPDPYRERNTRAAEWTGARSWVYRRAVTVPPLVAGERLVLELDGVDPSGTVCWDGEPVGRVPGLYHRGRFAVPAVPGEHRLAVVVDPVPASQPQVGRTELVRVHRPRMNEGWDFCPRFPHQGLWRGVRLVIGAALVGSASARASLDETGWGRVMVSTALEPGDADAQVELLDPDGELVARERVVNGRAGFDLRAPRRWHPRGYGGQDLYSVRVLVAGDVQWERRIGFRRATLEENPGAPAGALPYTAWINGRVVPLVGWNWVPADAQYGAVPADRVAHLVGLAARSGARVLRVWGGGLIETEEFYDACDRAGLLVWQEFSQSSSGMQSSPATDDEFVHYLHREAAAVVPARTHHPSLLLWCGGNELDADGRPLDEARSPALAALRDAVARLDPDRSWLPTSPSGPAFHNRLDVIRAAPQDQHDVHGPWEHQGLRAQYELYDAATSLAHTEFGVEGMTNADALDRLLPAGQQWPADRSNPAYRHLGEWWDNAPFVQQSFGGRLVDVAALRRASQLLQATGLAYAVEADRRRHPQCSMVLPWQLNESYPNAWCTSAVDYWGHPKPAYHAVTRAFARRRVTARTPTAVWAGAGELLVEAWVWDEDGAPPGSVVSSALRSADGAVLASTQWAIADLVTHPVAVGSLRVPAGDVPSDAVLVWELRWTAANGHELDAEAVLASSGQDFAPLLDLAPATVDVVAEPGAVLVTHRAGPLVVGLQVTTAGRPVLAGGDPRPLLPGASRRFRVDGPARVVVESWNTEPMPVDVPDKEITA